MFHFPSFAIFENFPFTFLITFEFSRSMLLANITFQSISLNQINERGRSAFQQHITSQLDFGFIVNCEFSAVLCIVHDTWSLTTINWYAMGGLMWESQQINFPSKFCFCFHFSLEHKSPNNMNIGSYRIHGKLLLSAENDMQIAIRFTKEQSDSAWNKTFTFCVYKMMINSTKIVITI